MDKSPKKQRTYPPKKMMDFLVETYTALPADGDSKKHFDNHLSQAPRVLEVHGKAKGHYYWRRSHQDAAELIFEAMRQAYIRGVPKDISDWVVEKDDPSPFRLDCTSAISYTLVELDPLTLKPLYPYPDVKLGEIIRVKGMANINLWRDDRSDTISAEFADMLMDRTEEIFYREMYKDDEERDKDQTIEEAIKDKRLQRMEYCLQLVPAFAALHYPAGRYSSVHDFDRLQKLDANPFDTQEEFDYCFERIKKKVYNDLQPVQAVDVIIELKKYTPENLLERIEARLEELRVEGRIQEMPNAIETVKRHPGYYQTLIYTLYCLCCNTKACWTAGQYLHSVKDLTEGELTREQFDWYMLVLGKQLAYEISTKRVVWPDYKFETFGAQIKDQIEKKVSTILAKVAVKDEQ